MKKSRAGFRARLMGSAACAVLMISAGAAHAQEVAKFDIAPQALSDALKQFGYQSGHDVLASPALADAKLTRGVNGEQDVEVALNQLLDGSGLTWKRTGETFLIVSASDPQSGSAAGDGADQGTVAALIVTAQKREENIQDVPIAMSAFTQEDLTRSQVATGADLMTQVPNMTFTKTNFTSYSIQIRGIGTQAISATVDPAVAVAFNNTPFLRAHFFEQEFFDMERVEVLRGPQGTLYGRNATAGVVNLISAKPKFHFEARASADVSNYSSHRLEGMLNLPLVEDKVALRLAGAWTKRDGFVTNQNTGKPIDGRDLWSTRVSLRIDPTERLHSNFIWEHFEEDDDRLRSGKQTCKHAQPPATIDGVPVIEGAGDVFSNLRYLDQGCDPASMYSPDAFGTPDGTTLPYYLPLYMIGAPILGGQNWDPYVSTAQSHDLRVIESQVDPHYRASSDTVELNVDFDLTNQLTFSSQTGFARDFIFSTEDYNRFNTKAGAFVYCVPEEPGTCRFAGTNQNRTLLPSPVGLVFGALSGTLFGSPCDLNSPLAYTCYTPGIFCDPQIGCSDRLVAMDLATARSRQFSQEFRVASSFDGPFNFSVGANYMRYKTEEDYYVFINSMGTIVAGEGRPDRYGNYPIWQPGISDNSFCIQRGFDYTQIGNLNPVQGTASAGDRCAYIDPNPITSLNGQGHNYFRNQNPYKLQSYAIFGEAYYDITPNLKLTAGLRWTVDKKHFDSIPSQLLVVGYGYPVLATINQEWREPTGRLVLDWKPDLSFTDQTMVYGSISHGYKAGGANPPGAALLVDRGSDISIPTHPATFKPEFVNAYEVGTKNTLLDGRLTFNLTGFYYDYSDYQISEIVDRSAINLNFDAKIWGVELESDWRPLENLRFGVKLGYEDTQVGDGQSAVDLMDRANGGRPDANGVSWMVIKPFPTQASNCILPTYVVAALMQESAFTAAMATACADAYQGNTAYGHVDPVTGLPYAADPTVAAPYYTIPAGYPGFNWETAPNHGAGISKDLSGNMLPNAPHWTGTLTADYTIPLPSDWLMTLHTDLYEQSEAWTRIFNLEGFDKLKAYTNVNLAAIFSNEDAGWMVMAYVKNIFDKDNITGAFLNSDDSGLTNNVFLNEPRLYGLRVTKTWSDSPWWSAHANKSGYYPLRVELEGYHGDMSPDHELFVPALIDHYAPDFPFPLGAQNDIASGNGGGVKFTYQPTASSWSASGSVRYGRAGGGTHKFARGTVEETCVINGQFCWYPGDARTTGYSYPQKYNWHRYSEVTTKSQEAHTFVDFAVGKDFGLGSVLGSETKMTVSGGLAYARFKSTSEATIHGRPEFYNPDSWVTGSGYTGYVFHQSHYYRHRDYLKSGREFKGAGPELNWSAAVKLLGDDTASGQIDLDVGLGGVVLFGKQNTHVNGNLEGTLATGNPEFGPSFYGFQTIYNTPIDISREKSATVPGVKANLGLAYGVGGVKVSGGYKWERYQKAIDGGLMDRKEYDRTFDGPYIKVSIGFGG